MKNVVPIRLQVEYVGPNNLLLDQDNQRRHSRRQIEQIAGAIREFSFLVPVVIDDRGQIVTGHARIVTAKRLGLAEVPAIRVRHLSESQLKAFRLADNKLAQNASWDERLLAQELTKLTEINLDFPITLTGFSTAEIDLVIEKQKKTPNADEAVVRTGPIICQPGDLWTLGKNRIFCGDSLQGESYVRLLEGKLAEMVFTDPPYNVRIEGNVSGKGKRKHGDLEQAAGEISDEQFASFLQTACSHLATHSQDGALVYLCMDWRHLSDVLLAGKEAFSELKNLVVWAKDIAGLGSLYRSAHELIFVFKSGTSSHINNIELGKHGRNRSSVWNCDSAVTMARKGEDVFDLHPTVKPVSMVMDAILDASNRGGLILDNFMGSGTTLLAAEKTGRTFCGIELDPAYVDTAIHRWQIMTGEDAVREDGKSFNDVERENVG